MKKIKILPSPIYYMGNKYRLLKKIKLLFPEKINTFLDLFGGSGVVAINAVDISNKVIYNEKSKGVFNMFKCYNEHHPYIIDSLIKKISKKAGLPINTQLKNVTNEEHEIYRNNFMKLRDTIIDEKLDGTIYSIILQQYSFSNAITFDNNGLITKDATTYGKRFYKEKLMCSKMENIYNKSIRMTDINFKDYKNYNFEENDFVYLDPPYSNTDAHYNRKNGWTEKDEDDLYEFILWLDKNNVKFALSNCLKNKGKSNDKLLIFLMKNNNFIVHQWGHKYTNMSLSGKVDETIECLITNYESGMRTRW